METEEGSQLTVQWKDNTKLNGAVPSMTEDAERHLKIWSVRFLHTRRLGYEDMPTTIGDFVKLKVVSALAVRPKEPKPVQVVEFRAEWHEAEGRLRKIATSIDLEELRDFYKKENARLKEIDRLNAEAKIKPQEVAATPPTPREPPKNAFGEPIGYYLTDGRLSAYLTWDLENESMLRLIAQTSEGSYLTGSNMRLVDGRIVCACSESLGMKARLCRHLKHAYLTGKDAKLMALKAIKLTHREIQVPIGIGNYHTKVIIARLVSDETEKDVPFLAIESKLEMNLKKVLGYVDQSPFLVADGEGLYGYIQHLEDLIRDHPNFKSLIHMSDDTLRGAWVMGGAGCTRRVHGPGIRQALAAGLITKNPNRTNFILATVASVVERELCLPHSQLGIGDDAPDFD